MDGKDFPPRFRHRLWWIIGPIAVVLLAFVLFRCFSRHNHPNAEIAPSQPLIDRGSGVRAPPAPADTIDLERQDPPATTTTTTPPPETSEPPLARARRDSEYSETVREPLGQLREIILSDDELEARRVRIQALRDSRAQHSPAGSFFTYYSYGQAPAREGSGEIVPEQDTTESVQGSQDSSAKKTNDDEDHEHSAGPSRQLNHEPVEEASGQEKAVDDEESLESDHESQEAIERKKLNKNRDNQGDEQ